MVLGHLVGNGCLSSFKGFGHKLLMVLVKKETKCRGVDSGGSLFCYPFSLILEKY